MAGPLRSGDRGSGAPSGPGAGDRPSSFCARACTRASIPTRPLSRRTARRQPGSRRYLKRAAIKRIFACGLATDYCVAFSALDARAAGFETFVIEDACRAIDANNSLDAAWARMNAAEVWRIQSRELLGLSRPAIDRKSAAVATVNPWLTRRNAFEEATSGACGALEPSLPWRRNGHALSSSLLPPFPFRPAGSGRNGDRAEARRGAGLGTAARIPAAGGRRRDAGAGRGPCARSCRAPKSLRNISTRRAALGLGDRRLLPEDPQAAPKRAGS